MEKTTFVRSVQFYNTEEPLKPILTVISNWILTSSHLHRAISG